MLKTARPAFSELLSGRAGNSYDAKVVLAKLREARRQIPFTPIQCFGLKRMTAPIGGPEPLSLRGQADFRL